jgi:bifunctional non-homologous end joining protein LigD
VLWPETKLPAVLEEHLIGMASRTTSTVEIEGRPITLSNLEKVLYPQAGFTKGQVIDYYLRVAPVLLPHLHDRPITLKRYPEGVNGMFFYEKSCPKYRPEWLQTTAVWSEGRGEDINYCMLQNRASLVWAANLADLELHTSLSVAKDVMQPTILAFDLDPGPPADIVQCCQVGLWLRDLFSSFGLDCFPKTSGSKGLQVYVPLNTPVTYDVTKPFAHAVARMLEDAHSQLVVSDMKKALRANKVFVDWSQNDDHKTTVTVYSLRAKAQPTVSTPVEWAEVEKCLKKKDASLLVFLTEKVLERVEKKGDLFEPVLKMKQHLPKPKDMPEQLAQHYERFAPSAKPKKTSSGIASKPRARKAR